MKIIKGDLILKEDTIFEESLKVEGDIICEGGLQNLKCWDLKCRNLKCWDLKCGNLECWDLECWDLEYYAVAFAYNSFKCKSVKGKRRNSKHFCLDEEIEFK